MLEQCIGNSHSSQVHSRSDRRCTHVNSFAPCATHFKLRSSCRSFRATAARSAANGDAPAPAANARAAHARRLAPRLHHARARMVGRHVLRSARARVSPPTAASPAPSASPTACSRPRARCRSICRCRMVIDSIMQNGALLNFRRDGNAFFASLLDPQQIGSHKAVTVYYHGKPRVGDASAMGRRLHLGRTTPRQSLGRHREPGARRQRLVAEQGHAGRRAGQPARRDHGARFDDRRLERPAAQHHAQRRSAPRRTSGSSSTPINNYDVAVNAGSYAHYTETYAGESGRARRSTSGRSPITSTRRRSSCSRRSRCSRASSTGSARIRGTRTATSSSRRRTSAWSTRAPWRTATITRTAIAARDRSQHRTRPRLGLHHRARERARVVRQQHHDEGHRRHVGARGLRELRREPLRRSARTGRRRARATSIGERANIKNDAPIVAQYGVNAKARATCTTRAATCCTPSARSSTTTRSGARILRGLNKTFWHQTVTGAAGRGLHQPAGRHRSEQGVRAVSDDHEDSRARVPHRGRHALLPLGERGRRLRHAGARDGRAATMLLRPTTSPQTTRIASGATVTVDPNFFVTAHRTVELNRKALPFLCADRCASEHSTPS